MSFGFAVGDFIAAGKLIKDIVHILRTAARAEYQELILELHGLQHALNHIERLRAPPEKESAITSIKVAALTCTHVLDEFAKKLRKFEDLSAQHDVSKARLWTQKLRWGFTMCEEVGNLRSYLLVHVGSLNMRLATEGLSSSFLVTQSVQDAEKNISEELKDSRTFISNLQISMAEGLKTITKQFVPQLNGLIELMQKIWQSNMKIIGLLTMIVERPTPALQYTYFQAPVKFEDALGRILPIPSEFDWLKFEAIIVAHFASSPGRDKVKAGEYELFDPSSPRQILNKTTLKMLRPGISITMAFIVGKYRHDLSADDRCPRPGCLSQDFNSIGGNRKQCTGCALCFDHACTQLPQPHRAGLFTSPSSTEYGLSLNTLDAWEIKRLLCMKAWNAEIEIHEHARNERLYYKNIRLMYTPLPPTPKVRNIRRFATQYFVFTIHLRELCINEKWPDPSYRTFRARNGGYICALRVNNTDYYTSAKYRSKSMARNAAAMQAYIVCKNKPANNAIDSGERPSLDQARSDSLVNIENVGRREHYSVASMASLESFSSMMSTRSLPHYHLAGRRNYVAATEISSSHPGRPLWRQLLPSRTWKLGGS